MRYLLDTHTFIWFSENNKLLSKKVAKEIKNLDNNCFLSIASLWEIAIKSGNGKLDLRIPFGEIYSFLSENNITILQVEMNNLYMLLTLEQFHRDPFDRIIISQAITEGFTIITTDRQFKPYPVKCLW